MRIKKWISILLACMMICCLAACGQTTTNTEETTQAKASSESTQTQKEETTTADGKNVLIVYFSWSSSGNTEKMAKHIQEQTGGDLFEIEPKNPYPTDYDECGEVAKEELDNNERPEISDLPDSIEQYDTIFIGYPIWLAYHKLIQCTL